MNSSKAYKVLAIVILLLGIIGGIVIGNLLSIPEGSLSNYKPEMVFNSTAMFFSWVSTLILFSIIYGIAYIIENQEDIATHQHNYYASITKQILEISDK